MDHRKGLRAKSVESALDAQLAVVVGGEVTKGRDLNVHDWMLGSLE
jgi:hypothetical protein